MAARRGCFEHGISGFAGRQSAVVFLQRECYKEAVVGNGMSVRGRLLLRASEGEEGPDTHLSSRSGQCFAVTVEVTALPLRVIADVDLIGWISNKVAANGRRERSSRCEQRRHDPKGSWAPQGVAPMETWEVKRLNPYRVQGRTPVAILVCAA